MTKTKSSETHELLTAEILFLGNIPKPFGGVGTYCKNLVEELGKEDYRILFFMFYNIN